MARHVGLLAGVVGLAGLSAVLVVLVGEWSRPALPVPTVFQDKTPRFEEVPPPAREPGLPKDEPAENVEYSFRTPSGEPSALTCEDARRIVRQVRATLAYDPPSVSPSALAAATIDWLDPHGLWSASPDSPIAPLIDRDAQRLVRELEDDDTAPCSEARLVGEAMVRWMGELRAIFDESRRLAKSEKAAPAGSQLSAAAEDGLFQDEARPARDLARILGANTGRLEHGVGDRMTPYADAGRGRYLPSLDGEHWADVVRAALVRAYVQVLDPHGAWASRDEEVSVYDIDLDAHPPDRLWDQGIRTALGVRVESGPMEPLEVGDLVLAIAGVTTAGLSPEQIDQLVYATTDTPTSAPLVILRHGEHDLRTLVLAPPDEPLPSPDAPAPLTSYRVPYGAGDALVVEIHDVRSDLGEELSATLHKQARADTRAIVGLLLDLRDDGGGSTEGAIAAIGLFLPGAPLFSMIRRDGFIEVDRAPEPPLADRWTGPLATLVDGDTASAAEMISGALMAYRRAAVVGWPTYGKGCAQEYLDDDAHVGVLRLTTLLYALPDGSPVQGVGIEPLFLLPTMGRANKAADFTREREADVPNSPPTWRGPDVRDRTLVLPPANMTWPEPHGAIGPCRDADVCHALHALGATNPGKRPAAALTAAPAASGRR